MKLAIYRSKIKIFLELISKNLLFLKIDKEWAYLS